MMQFIAIALLAYIAYRFYNGMKKKPLQQQQSSTDEQRPSISTVRCAYCRVHLPATDAIRIGQSSPRYFCCEEHAHQSQQRN